MPESELARLSRMFSGERDTSLISDLIEKSVPIHLGGMCDPFSSGDPAGITARFLHAARTYPVMISTKASRLPGEVWDTLDPQYHVFQLSITGFPDDVIRIFEANTPTTSERIAFARRLKGLGFTVFVRIQPLVQLEWARTLVVELGHTVDGFTIEHLKLPSDNKARYRELCDMLNRAGVHVSMVQEGREFIMGARIKRKNIEALLDVPRTARINVGDNDLRLLSETENCCGITLCPPSFCGWLRYNSMALQMGGDSEAWRPTADGRRIGLNSSCIRQGWGYDDYVKANRRALYGDPDQVVMDF